jgi:hypothetical protein
MILVPSKTGPVRTGLVGPKMPMMGVPTELARCMPPVSLQTTTLQKRRWSMNSESPVFPARSMMLVELIC